jgi:hypothetical protein
MYTVHTHSQRAVILLLSTVMLASAVCFCSGSHSCTALSLYLELSVGITVSGHCCCCCCCCCLHCCLTVQRCCCRLRSLPVLLLHAERSLGLARALLLRYSSCCSHSQLRPCLYTLLLLYLSVHGSSSSTHYIAKYMTIADTLSGLPWSVAASVSFLAAAEAVKPSRFQSCTRLATVLLSSTSQTPSLATTMASWASCSCTLLCHEVGVRVASSTGMLYYASDHIVSTNIITVLSTQTVTTFNNGEMRATAQHRLYK